MNYIVLYDYNRYNSDNYLITDNRYELFLDQNSPLTSYFMSEGSCYNPLELALNFKKTIDDEEQKFSRTRENYRSDAKIIELGYGLIDNKHYMIKKALT